MSAKFQLIINNKHTPPSSGDDRLCTGHTLYDHQGSLKSHMKNKWPNKSSVICSRLCIFCAHAYSFPEKKQQLLNSFG